MATIVCPYCDIEVSMSAVEGNDGCCPECGAVITASTVLDERDEDAPDEAVAESEEDDDEEL